MSQLAIFLLWYIIDISSAVHPQYGFAHRVNNESIIQAVLQFGGNAIELDICYNTSWHVSHDARCLNTTVTLIDWLFTVNDTLKNNPTYQSQLAMIWIDIKTPNVSAMNSLPNIIHSAQLPSQIDILYDLGNFDNNGKTGFLRIAHQLNINEGISFCVGNECSGDNQTVSQVYKYYKSNNFSRGTLNSGNSAEDKQILETANYFSDPNDMYGFKLLLVWTLSTESEMKDYINPNHSYHVNGAVIGEYSSVFQDSDTMYIESFANAVNAFNDTYRMGTALDAPFLYITIDSDENEKDLNHKSVLLYSYSIIGIAMGILCVLWIILFGYLWWKRWKRRNETNQQTMESDAQAFLDM